MPWGLLVSAIPYLVAAAIGGKLAWSIQGHRIDGLKADVTAAESATAAARAERDNWREVAAECGARSLALEADSNKRLAQAARQAQAARAAAQAADQALERLRAQRAAQPAGTAKTCDEAIDAFKEAIR
jgi:hypothetical protein